ncbi:hypothetical protein R1flu_024517 [Riccia fluitans]|uniref:Uncharacterized protein n=1 Tax=Riccia fluitans TaxID=41844 RepID=A0ABD1XV49_9MARC
MPAEEGKGGGLSRVFNRVRLSMRLARVLGGAGSKLPCVPPPRSQLVSIPRPNAESQSVMCKSGHGATDGGINAVIGSMRDGRSQRSGEAADRSCGGRHAYIRGVSADNLRGSSMGRHHRGGGHHPQQLSAGSLSAAPDSKHTDSCSRWIKYLSSLARPVLTHISAGMQAFHDRFGARSEVDPLRALEPGSRLVLDVVVLAWQFSHAEDACVLDAHRWARYFLAGPSVDLCGSCHRRFLVRVSDLLRLVMSRAADCLSPIW